VVTIAYAWRKRSTRIPITTRPVAILLQRCGRIELAIIVGGEWLGMSGQARRVGDRSRTDALPWQTPGLDGRSWTSLDGVTVRLLLDLDGHFQGRCHGDRAVATLPSTYCAA